jgi:hypothetical protein
MAAHFLEPLRSIEPQQFIFPDLDPLVPLTSLALL